MQSNLKFSERPDGTYSAKIYRDTERYTDVSVPVEYLGRPVTELVFGGGLELILSSLNIPASIESIVFKYPGEVTSYVLTEKLYVDECNPHFKTDGSSLFSKDGKALLRFLNSETAVYSVPEGVGILCGGAFACLPKLEGITLPRTLREIGDHCFANCNNLKSIVFSEGLELIGARAFQSCGSIEEISIPHSVKAIGGKAFEKTEQLRVCRLPDSLRRLEKDLFRESGLEKLHIPASVEEIEYGSLFTYRDKLLMITVDNNNDHFCAEDGTLYSKDKTVLLQSGGHSVMRVPDGVAEIAANAFANSKAEEVILPDSCRIIGDRAFKGCELLRKINLNSVEKIGREAFFLCSSLKSAELSCKIIGEKAFMRCDILNVTLSEGVKNIKRSAFTLTEIRSITFPESLCYIGKEAFFGCPEQQSVTIPRNVRALGEFALGCLREITIFDSLIRDKLFWIELDKLIIRSSETGEILNTVHFGYAQSIAINQKMFSCFNEDWSYDFDKADSYIEEFFDTISAVRFIYQRTFCDTVPPSAAVRSRFEEYVHIHGTECVRLMIERFTGTEELSRLSQCGIITAENISELIEFAVQKNAVEYTAFLLDYKNKFPYPTDGILSLDQD